MKRCVILRATRAALLGCAVAAAAWLPLPAAGESTADPMVERMAEWQRDARAALTRASEPAAAEMLPDGIRPVDLAARRRDLEETLLAINRHDQALQTRAELERALEMAKLANESWSGFSEEPPYSILLLDALASQRDAAVEKLGSRRSSIAIVQKTLDDIVDEEQSVAEALRRANTEADRGGDAAVWRAESARYAQRLLNARKATLTAALANTRLQAAAAEAEVALLDRQIAIVEADHAFSEDDLERIQQASRQRQAALKNDLDSLRARARRATTTRDRAIEAHARALENESADGTTVSPELLQATARLQTAETTVDSLQLMAQAHEWLMQIESYHLTAQEARRTMLTTTDRADRFEAETAIRSLIDRLVAWETVTANEIAGVAADISRVEARSAALGADDERLAVLREQRAILLERQATVQLVVRAASQRRRQLERWLVDHQTRKRSLGERASEWTYKTGEALRGMLNIEVFQYTKGEGEGSQRSVTLAKLFTALLAFLIPYLVAYLAVRRIQRTTVSMKLIGEAQANTLRNWMMILIGCVLALIALKFLDIPLTVFAFFGGALAIGLGFGMQTLIKNFISGIIMLFERRIRVGDILDVDGIIGTVTEINTRSSVVRSADGLETMVPNSLFLENRVTNLTLTNRCNRRVVRVGVAYGTPPSRVIEALRDCVDRHGLVLKDPEPMVLFEEFADSALMFAVYFWVEFNDRTNPMQVASDLRLMIEKRFADLGISIPFPQHDIHFRGTTPVTVRLERETKPPRPAP